MRRRGKWLVLSLLLLGLVFALMPSADPSAPRTSSPTALKFPRRFAPDDYARMTRRRTLAPRTLTKDEVDQDVVVLRKRDPVLVALPPHAESLAVFEAKAILDAPAGRMLIACMAEDGAAPELERHGFTAADVERVAFAKSEAGDDLLVLSGPIAARFEDRTASDLHSAHAYGEHGTIYREPIGPTSDAGTAGPPRYGASWRKELLLFGESEQALRDAVDRLEGRRTDPQAISEDDSYGEAYGRLSSTTLTKLLPSELRERVLQGAPSVGFHVDANKDVLLVVDADGHGQDTQDLGKALGAAIAARRVQAVMEGDDELSELLDYFKVMLHDEGFSLDAAFPIAFVEDALGECAQRSRDTKPATTGAAGSEH